MHANVKKGVNKMPNVDGEEFAYTPAGIKAAKEKAQETGEDLNIAPAGIYDAGGRVKKIKGYYGGGMVADYMGGYTPSNITGLSSVEAGKKNLAIGSRTMKDGGKVKEEK